MIDPQRDKFVKDWTPLPQEYKHAETTTGITLSYWQDVRRRLFENKVAIASIYCIILIMLASIFGPMLTGKTYEAQQRSLRNMPPRIEIQTSSDGANFYVHPDLNVFLVEDDGFVSDELPPVSANLSDKMFIFEHNGNPYYLTFSADGIK